MQAMIDFKFCKLRAEVCMIPLLKNALYNVIIAASNQDWQHVVIMIVVHEKVEYDLPYLI